MKQRASYQLHDGDQLQEKAEVSALVGRWLHAFARHRQGCNCNAYLWHIFSAGGYACDEGNVALQNYQQHQAHRYYVLSNCCKQAVLTEHKPEKLDFPGWCDFYVFPENMAWTMAFTHEDGLQGPYFAKHQDYTRLIQRNQQQLAKQQQIAHAKLKGWL